MSDNFAAITDAPVETLVPPSAEVVKQELASYAAQVKELLTIDLKAIPAGKQTVSPGGKARTPLYMIAESAQINRIVADYIAGRELRQVPREETAAYYASFDTEEKALAFLNEATAELVCDINALDPASLFVVRDGFHGMPSTVHADASFAAAHMMYHVGQLNYIHTLYGDTKIHWW